MNYLKPILLFSFVIPAVILFSLLAGGIFGKGWLGGEYEKRKLAFEEMKENEQKAIEMENRILPYRGAVAYFSEMEKKRLDQTLPSLLEDLCNGRYQGYVIRTGFRVEDIGEDEEVNMEFLGRYDSMQKMMSELQVQFPFLKFSQASFRPVEPTTSVPSRHLSATFKAFNDVQQDQKGGGQ